MPAFGVELARAGEDAAAGRLHRYARCAAARTRSGEGWFAVATGVEANDMNGVVSQPGASIPGDLADDLIEWFAQQRLPASWLLAGEDRELATTLVERGASPEVSGWWAGRLIEDDLLRLSPVPGITISRVTTEEDLGDWLDVAGVCGWFDHEAGRSVRKKIYLSVGLDDADELSHWVVRRAGHAVGMASSFLSRGSVLDLCNLAVVHSERRQGIGRALAAERIRAASALGARTIVSASSPDGWRLYRSLRFQSVPVTPDRWFYLPTCCE
jgi:GNAT superfamily N-acetyltransferase